MRFLSTGFWLRRLRGALLVLVFVSAFIYIFSLNFRIPDKMDRLQRFATEIASPPLQLVGNVFSYFEGFFKSYIWLRNLRTENESLKQRIAKLQNQVTAYQEAFIENQKLRRLLDFKKTTGYETIAAQVVVHDLTGWFQTLMVDKGFRDGVGPDMPVVNEEGVVGRILDVSDHYSRVLLITDQGSAVDAIDVRNRLRGILCGKDASGCLLKYVNANLDMDEGDLIITSGKDGIFPKGLRLGIVHAVYRDPASMFQRIGVKPLVQLSTIEEVLIIKRGKITMGPVVNAVPKTVDRKGAGTAVPTGVGADAAAQKRRSYRAKHGAKAGSARVVSGGEKKTRLHRAQAVGDKKIRSSGQSPRVPAKKQR